MKPEEDKCSVTMCKNRQGAGITLYKFPKVKRAKDVWKTFCGIQIDEAVPSSHQVCSAHFTEECFYLEDATMGTNLAPTKALKKYGNLVEIILVLYQQMSSNFLLSSCPNTYETYAIRRDQNGNDLK